MSRVIWKYDVPSSPSKAPMKGGFFDVQMPVGAEIVCFDKQRGKPRMWVLLNPKTISKKYRRFLIVGTGEKIPDNALYIGSWQTAEDDLVWHLFENT